MRALPSSICHRPNDWNGQYHQKFRKEWYWLQRVSTDALPIWTSSFIDIVAMENHSSKAAKLVPTHTFSWPCSSPITSKKDAESAHILLHVQFQLKHTQMPSISLGHFQTLRSFGFNVRKCFNSTLPFGWYIFEILNGILHCNDVAINMMWMNRAELIVFVQPAVRHWNGQKQCAKAKVQIYRSKMIATMTQKRPTERLNLKSTA